MNLREREHECTSTKGFRAQILTLKTTRKNGRKWSNISVKKYHHKPVFGVKSGKVSLGNWSGSVLTKDEINETHVAPHVWGTHWVPPTMMVEVIERILVYRMNCPKRGNAWRKLAVNGRGDARREWGSLMRSSDIGNKRTRLERSMWRRKERRNRDGDARPRIDVNKKTRWEGKL